MPHEYSTPLSDKAGSRSAARNNTAAVSRPAVPATTGVAQLFGKATHNISGKNVKGFMSENGNYFVVAGESFIYATAAPRSCEEADPTIHNFNGKSYKLYKPKMKFYEDCLHTAEEIINGKKLSYGTATYSRETETGYVFGQSDTRNIEIAKQAKLSTKAVNANASPGVGQAYVIVDIEYEDNPSKRCPYHAAAVVAVDGNDRITMEVFAGGAVTNRNTNSIFDIYEVGGGDSFHSYWKANYFKGYDVITIVIDPK